MALSERQLAAAHRLGQDVCVVAGPGSGKTSVLIERFSWLVRERGVEPGRILAITFTEKAATEIKQRAVREFENEPALRQQIERAYVSTIHAFCARILRENAIDAGIDPAFKVLDTAWLLLREVADEVLEAMYEEDRGRMGAFLRSLAVATVRDGFVPDVATSLVQIHDALRLAGATVDSILRTSNAAGLDELRRIAEEILRCPCKPNTPKQRDQHEAAREWAGRVLELGETVRIGHFEVLDRPKLNMQSLVKGSMAHVHEPAVRELLERAAGEAVARYYERERRMIADTLRRVGDEYRRRKRAASALDFDDLEEFAIDLLMRDETLRERIRSGFDYILMDELQDTNPLQWKLMELVRRPDSFFAVGDVNQSIYGFRHANPRLFGEYRNRLESAGLTVDELRDNYRSRPEVLSVVNRVFAGEAGVEPHTLESRKEFPAKSDPSAEVLVMFGKTSADTEPEEAKWVAHRIGELVGEGKAQFGDIAVLVRANSSTAALQHAMDAYGIPAVVVGGLTFYETREVRDLKLLLDVVANPRNEVALAGLLRSPLFGVTDEEIFALSQGGSLRAGVRASPPRHWAMVEELRRLRNQVSPDLLLRRAMDECDYESGLSDRARANVEKLLAMLRTRYQESPAPLSRLLAELEDAQPAAEAPPPELTGAVQLMTLHKAKGLEFPVVFLPFLHRTAGGGAPVVSYTHEHGLGVKWRNPATEKGCGDPAWGANDRAGRERAPQEENRLLYVGMTRAREHLVLSWSRTERKRGTWNAMIAAKLGVDVQTPSNEPQVIDGVRVFTTDRKAPEPLAGVSARASAAVQVIDPVVAQGAADGSASVTDISRFAGCPRQYYLSRYLGWKKITRRLPTFEEDEVDDAPEDLSASELGRVVHSVLAGEAPKDVPAEALELASKFTSSELGRASKRGDARYEWDFVMEEGGVVLRGQVDLWFERGRDLVLVDYKTDRRLDPEALEAYSLQLQLYAVALERYTGKLPTRAVLFLLREGREHDVDVSALALGGASDVVRQFREAQTSQTFPLVEGTHCGRCDFYRGLCPAGRDAAK